MPKTRQAAPSSRNKADFVRPSCCATSAGTVVLALAMMRCAKACLPHSASSDARPKPGNMDVFLDKSAAMLWRA
eukprot:4019091-Alexandrium_andersonii.AAC.1